MKFQKNPDSGDPSTIHQDFEKIDLNIHCCRYWWLKKWKHQRLSYPYWRLYWNKVSGAYVFFEQRIMLDPDQIVLIPPHTPFNTDIIGQQGEDEAHVLEGGWINNPSLEEEIVSRGYIPHFFIHFNLGFQFDNLRPGIYPSKISAYQTDLIRELTGVLVQGKRKFGPDRSLGVYHLILSAVSKIPAAYWERFSFDSRIGRVLIYIDQNLKIDMNNEYLAGQVHMATNSFARLFRQQTGKSPQEYIRARRIEHASKLLYHTELSIKEISEECGFNDRYYFTRVFSRTMHVPPAGYRRKLILNRT